MAIITRLSVDGYGAKRAGSFAGKAASADGPHTPGRITRLSLDGYGAKRHGSFAGKETEGGGPHPVGRITRLSLDGYGVKRAGAFGGKEASGISPVTVEQTGRWQPLRKRKERIRIKVNADIIELYGVDEVSRVLTELRKDVPRAAKARAVEIARAATPLTDISHDVIELVEAPSGAVEELTLMLDDIDRYYWSVVYTVMRQIEDDDVEVILLMTMH